MFPSPVHTHRSKNRSSIHLSRTFSFVDGLLFTFDYIYIFYVTLCLFHIISCICYVINFFVTLFSFSLCYLISSFLLFFFSRIYTNNFSYLVECVLKTHVSHHHFLFFLFLFFFRGSFPTRKHK